MPPYSSFNDEHNQSSSHSNNSLKVSVLDVKWPERTGVILSHTETYGCGIGSEYVYCYTYKTHLELAELKGENRFRIKVGSAKGDPIERIHSQIAVNKTAISEPPLVLLIFRTLAAGHLERWLHTRLYRSRDAIGAEWFNTSIEELVSLFQQYLNWASSQSFELNDTKAQFTPCSISSEIPRSDLDKSDVPAATAALKATVDSDRTSAINYYRQGELVDDLLESSKTPLTIVEIAQRLSLPVKRVEKHIAYEVNKNRCSINEQGQVVFHCRRNRQSR